MDGEAVVDLPEASEGESLQGRRAKAAKLAQNKQKPGSFGACHHIGAACCAARSGGCTALI
jgi:hypothetical protein